MAIRNTSFKVLYSDMNLEQFSIQIGNFLGNNKEILMKINIFYQKINYK